MKVKMSKTVKGSPDGITVKTYEAGEEYNLSTNLADVFVDEMKIATKVRPRRAIKIQTPKKVKIQTPEKEVKKTTKRTVKKIR